DALGGVYVAGYTSGSFDGAPPRGGGRDIFVLKFDADGNRQWSSQYGVAERLAFADGLAPDPDGGVYVGGQTDHPENRFRGDADALVLRFAPDGRMLWARKVDGGYYEVGQDVVADRTGVYLIGGILGGDLTHDVSEPRQGQYN